MTTPRPYKSDAAILPWALCTLDEAKHYLKRTTNDFDGAIIDLINDVTGWIETRTRRRLRSRTYDGTASPNQPVLMVNGTDDSEIDVGEWPVTGLTSARYLVNDLAGTFQTIDVTGWRETAAGWIFIPSGEFPQGSRNIELKVTAGYLAGVHDNDLRALRRATLRMCQVFWQDFDLATGRGTGVSVDGHSFSLVNADLPKDVGAILEQYERIL